MNTAILFGFYGLLVLAVSRNIQPWYHRRSVISGLWLLGIVGYLLIYAGIDLFHESKTGSYNKLWSLLTEIVLLLSFYIGIPLITLWFAERKRKPKSSDLGPPTTSSFLQTSIEQPHSKELPHENLQCPNCGGQLVRRSGRHGHFYGCKSFPQCRYTRSISMERGRLG